MKVSLSWLQDYVTIDRPVEELADMLTMAGLEVEAIEDRYAYLEKILVGRISAIESHPNADKLKLCEVQADGRTYRVVCGAPNAEVGLNAPLALPGSILPGGLSVSASTIRGQASQGMLCSEAELGLGPDRSGLMAMDLELTPGTPLNKALALSDAVLEIGLTPNRADCLSFLGIAREIAGFQGTRIKRPEIRLPAGAEDINALTSVIVEDVDHCPRYTARLLTNVTVKPSPFWLQDRLLSIGLRPINNLVDITNYVMMETGQPLHAFDFDRLEEHRIVVRTARRGETFVTLDEKQRSLEDDMLMICDGVQPVGIGGIMGGLNSEIEDTTRRVLIESAFFNPVSIRKTAKRLGLTTDASHRFERGVDPEGTIFALDRTAQLMAELGGGQLISGTIDIRNELPIPPVIRLSVAAANRVLGTSLTGEAMADLLRAIEFEVTAGDEDTLNVCAPSFRMDINRPEDLMEEVARRHGYGHIPVTFPTIPANRRPKDKLLDERQHVRTIMQGLGFTEIITYSFVHAQSCDRLKIPADDERRRQVQILNPLSEEQAVMRISLVPGLLDTMHRNIAHQAMTLKLFEVGKTFMAAGQNRLPREVEFLAGLWTGDRHEAGWHAKPEACDFYDIKGAVEALLAALKIAPVRFTQLEKNQCAYFQPGVAARIIAGDQKIGALGAVKIDVLRAYDLKQKVFIFEIDFKRLIDCIPDLIQARTLPRYPSVSRDATLIVDKELEADAILEQIRQMEEPLVEEVRLFDVFEGKPIPDGHRSLSLRIIYRSSEETLEDETVNRLHRQIIDHLITRFKAELPA